MAKEDFLIRRLGAGDAAELGLLFERNDRDEVRRFFHPFPMARSSAEQLLHLDRRDLFFGVLEADRIIAFSMLRGWDEGFDIPSFGVLVDFEKRGVGLGRRLTEWTLRWADKSGCPRVRLSIHEENQTAYALYTSLGFKETDRNVESNGLLRLVMHRERGPTRTQVFVSTQCLPADEPLGDRLQRLYAAGLHHVELSNYSVTDSADFPDGGRKFPRHLMLHHFFPPEPRSLVLNLASRDDMVRKETLNFFRRGLDWSAALGAPFYSIHAGYITDPVGKDRQGFVFPLPESGEYSRALNRFVDGLINLARYADERKVTLLVENNVVTDQHRGKLLLSTPAEFKELFINWPEDLPIGILLDWGHWQITSRTLKLSLDSFAVLRERVRGLHLHTNDGLFDQHEPFMPDETTLDAIHAFRPAFVTLEGRYKDLRKLQAATLHMEELLP